jgi:cobalt/nickel transport system permease protein
MLLHIGAFHLDLNSKQTTLWHLLAPRTRLLCTLLMVFAIALTPNGRWWTWGDLWLRCAECYLAESGDCTVLLKRIAVEFAFVGVVLLGTLFREGGEVLWSWGVLKITTVGLTVLGSVTLKALLSLMMLKCIDPNHFHSSIAQCLSCPANSAPVSRDFGIHVSLHQCLD